MKAVIFVDTYRNLPYGRKWYIVDSVEKKEQILILISIWVLQNLGCDVFLDIT